MRILFFILILLSPLHASERAWEPIQWEPWWDYKLPPLDKTVTLIMTLPIEQEDGTVITTEEIDFATIFCYHHGEVNTRIEAVVPRKQMSVMENNRVGHTWNNIIPNEMGFSCRTRVMSVNGIPSNWSEEVQYGRPAAPFDLRIQ